MKIPQTIEPSFDDYISIAYMINLFKSHKKIIFIPVIIGAIMGGPLTNFIEPVYKGSAFFSFAKVSGVLVMDPQVFASKTYVNNFFSKKTYENCNPSFYKDKDFNYDISTIVKTLSLKDSDLIELNMQNKNKTVIKDCLNSMIDDLRTSQNTIADPIIQLKINNLRLAEEKLKNNEEFLIKLIDKQIRGLKKMARTLQKICFIRIYLYL